MNVEKDDSMILTIDDEDLGYYTASLSVKYESNAEEETIKSQYGGNITLNKFGLESLFKLFYIIKAETNYMTPIQLTEKDTRSRVNEVLFNYFNDVAEDGEDMEIALKQDIDTLKEMKFLSCDLKNTFNQIELDDILEIFKEIRKQKIKFFEAILEEYLENEEKYNSELGIS